MAKAKTRAANLPVPQSREEAAKYVHDIGAAQRRIARIEADMNDAIASAKKQAEYLAAPLRDQVETLTNGLRIWADANRDALTDSNKRKYADLGTGKVEWRLSPPKVTIRGLEQVIERIKALKLADKFLRVKEEINKEAMLADPEAATGIVGVSIGTAGESFSVEPFEAEVQGAE